MAKKDPFPATDSERRSLKEIWEEASGSQDTKDDLVEEIYRVEIKCSEFQIGEIDANNQSLIMLQKKGTDLEDVSKENLQKAISVCVSQEHQVVLVSLTGNSSIAMLGLQDGEIKEHIRSNELKSPWGIAIKDDIVYVTDTVHIGIIAFSITLPNRVERSNFQNIFKQPRQLAINSGDELWVADNEGKAIIILNKQLEKIDEIREIKGLNIDSPIDVKFSYREACILSLDKNRRASVHIFEQNTRDYLKTTINSTIGVPIQSYSFAILSNLILIPDYFSKSILVYDFLGKKKYEIILKLPSIPLSIDISKDTIYVLCSKLSSAQLKKI